MHASHVESLNLAYKFVFLKSDWVEGWLLHVKSVFNWFSKSAARTEKCIKTADKVMKMLCRVVCYLMKDMSVLLYCPTRWLGLHQALLSMLNVWDLLLLHTNNLITNDECQPDCRSHVNDPTTDELNGEDL